MTGDNPIVAPAWSTPMLVAGLGLMLVGAAALVLPISLAAQRRVYWGGWILGSIVGAICVVHRGWGTAVLVAFAAISIAVVNAYFFTSYLKIGGRVRSPYIRRTGEEPPPDAYRNMATPATVWWITAVMTVFGGTYTLLSDRLDGITLAFGAMISACTAAWGHLDKADGFPIARKQYVPFAVTVAASIPLLLIPIAVYFAAYWASPVKGARFEDVDEP